MNKIETFIKEKWMYLAGFMIPLLIGIIHSALADTWVTGHGNISSGDVNSLVIPLAYELWDRFHASNWTFFTWHLMDGLGFDNAFGYLSNHSFFALIMMLIPRNAIPDYIQLTMLLKLSLCGLTMTYFFYNTKFNKINEAKKAVSLFLGLAFALGNGVVSYLYYPSFLEVLFMFPLLLFLVEKMILEKKWKLYYVILTYTIWADMYLAYQVCIFLVIWFFIVMVSFEDDNKKKSFLIFAGSSLLSGFTWLGGILSGLLNASGRHSIDDSVRMQDYLHNILLKPVDFIKQLFVFRSISNVNSLIPDIYFSVTALVLVLLYPFIKIERKRKIICIITAAFIILSFFFGRLSLIWHLFSIPNGVYHRFKNLFVFIMLFMLLEILSHLEELKLKQIIIAIAVSIIFYIFAISDINELDSVETYLFSIILIVFISLMCIFYKKGSIIYKNFLYVIAVCGIVEICINAGNSFEFYDKELFYGENGITDSAVEILSQAELEDGERIVSYFPTQNIGMITGQNADSGFVPALNFGNRNLHVKLGMGYGSNVMYGSRGASPLINLLFNIRYGHGESEMLFSDAEYITGDQYCSLYRLERLAGLGYMVDDKVTSWDVDSDLNCFEFQNDFLKKAVDTDAVFSNVDIDVQCIDAAFNAYEPDNDDNTSGYYSYSYDTNPEKDANVRQFDVTMKEDADLYVKYDGNYAQILIYVDGEFKHMDGMVLPQSTYHIGDVKEGQTVSICVIPENQGLNYKTNINLLFAKFDNSVYSEAYDKLSSNVYNIDTFESDYVKGNIQADKSGIMMTSVPASNGFHVYVDGNETEYKVIAGALIGVPLESGKHEVEFRYKPQNVVVSYGACGLSFMIYLILCFVTRKKKNIA